jgi:hypothetical protein
MGLSLREQPRSSGLRQIPRASGRSKSLPILFLVSSQQRSRIPIVFRSSPGTCERAHRSETAASPLRGRAARRPGSGSPRRVDCAETRRSRGRSGVAQRSRRWGLVSCYTSSRVDPPCRKLAPLNGTLVTCGAPPGWHARASATRRVRGFSRTGQDPANDTPETGEGRLRQGEEVLPCRGSRLSPGRNSRPGSVQPAPNVSEGMRRARGYANRRKPAEPDTTRIGSRRRGPTRRPPIHQTCGQPPWRARLRAELERNASDGNRNACSLCGASLLSRTTGVDVVARGSGAHPLRRFRGRSRRNR